MDSPAGLRIHRASRVERLADRLAVALEQRPPRQPLAAQQVVVSHPGLGSWLLQFLARRRGADGRPGIAANLEFLLPGEWLLQLAAARLPAGRRAAPAWQRESLRWRILQQLPVLDEPQLQRYLADDAGGRRAFQLADHLAALFTQYLIYRRGWIADAEAGRQRHWQARLWRTLAGDIALPHRATSTVALIESLAAESPADDTPVHLFGLNHLPPDGFAAVAALATRAEVNLYFADPSASYWHDLYSERALARAEARGRAGHAETGHSLLAALARHGQGFNRALDRLEPVDDGRDPADEEPGSAEHLLARLQDSIRLLDEQRLDGPTDPTDRSLRVHACHTRLRELEVLRDALLDRLAAQPALRLAEIVVMAPDIGAYASLIPAVFGRPGQFPAGERGHLPYRIADRALSAQHPLLHCVEQLLRLPESRLEAAELRALLAVPAVARQLQLGVGELDVLERWLARSRVQWGLDGAMKGEFCGVSRPEHSWEWALDRMLLGLMVGDDPGFDGFAGLQPVAPAAGPDADTLGRLRQLLRRLADGRRRMQQRRPLSHWCDWLLGWFDELFLTDRDDPAEHAALAALRERIAGLPDAARLAGCDPELDWPAVREAIRGALDGPPSQPRFLEGGLTFCGMVPARVVPFRMVCILGLDEAAFPRQTAASSLNLISQAPREGDRDPVDEDRYLFLECLMSARDALHLSFRGEGADDGKPRNPAAPLAELLGFLDRRLGDDTGPETMTGKPTAISKPWLLRHALQPFDARYFGAQADDPRWFSYAAAYADAVPAAADEFRRSGLLAAWPATPVGPDAAPTTDSALPLAELQRFLRSPLRHYCERRLRLRLDVLDDNADAAEERFTPRSTALDRLELQLLERALWQRQPIDPVVLPAWLRGAGLLPLGEPGEEAYRRAARLARAAEQASREAFGAALDDRHRLPLQVRIDGREVLAGTLQPLVRHDGRWLLPRWRFGAELAGRHLLPAFVDWATLCLALPAGAAPPRLQLLQVCEHKGRLKLQWSPHCSAWSDGDPARVRARAEQGLRFLLDCHRLGSQAPLPWLPYSSWACAMAEADRRDSAVRKAWASEGSYAPPYPRFLLGEDGPFRDGVLLPAFVELANHCASLLLGSLPVETEPA